MPSTAQNNLLAGAFTPAAQSEYFFQRQEDFNGYSAENKLNKLEFLIDPTGYMVRQPSGIGNPFNLDFLIQSVQGQLIDMNPVSTVSDSSRLEYKYHGYNVQYINNNEGLRQNFIINTKNGNSGLLQIDLRIKSSLRYSFNNENQLVFSDSSGKTLMIYDQLKAWDATGKVLPATMKLHKDVLMLQVGDANAVYPVTIDPLNHTVTAIP